MEADQRSQRAWATLTYNSEPGGWRKCAQTSPWWGRSNWGGIWARWRCRPCPAGCRFLLCSNPPALTGWQTSPRHTGRSSRQCFGSGCGSPARPPWGDKTGHANRQKFFLDVNFWISLSGVYFLFYLSQILRLNLMHVVHTAYSVYRYYICRWHTVVNFIVFSAMKRQLIQYFSFFWE